jgi:hypothetical protein
MELSDKNLDAMILGELADREAGDVPEFWSLDRCTAFTVTEEHGRGPSGYIHGHGFGRGEISAYITGSRNKAGVEFVNNTQLVTVLANTNHLLYPL